ncbi:hypothetical protein NCS52_00957300 [Fusarium sp. LHS14.1]|nr:hypothetical protein NCS52_00957300 [Fusarium sp. LHS14.1]
MKAVSVLYFLTVASAMSIQPRQFGGRFRGRFGGGGNFGNGIVPVDNVPQNDNGNGNVNVPQNGNGGNGDATDDTTGDANGNVPQNNDGNNNNAGNDNNTGADGGSADDTTNGGGATDDTTNNDGAADGTTGNDGAAGDNGNGGGAADDATNGGADQAADGQTVVFTEIGGVPGNECLTFRNNGEIVDAACVNEAADRQLTPSGNALQVQRTFTAGFRPDLVDVQACVGFNGTHFRAEDCNAQGIELVTFSNGELRASGGACASGHDDLAQMTVDPAGNTCATYTTTNVQPAAV